MSKLHVEDCFDTGPDTAPDEWGEIIIIIIYTTENVTHLRFFFRVKLVEKRPLFGCSTSVPHAQLIWAKQVQLSLNFPSCCHRNVVKGYANLITYSGIFAGSSFMP